jgi:hypothetical protein
VISFPEKPRVQDAQTYDFDDDAVVDHEGVPPSVVHLGIE